MNTKTKLRAMKYGFLIGIIYFSIVGFLVKTDLGSSLFKTLENVTKVRLPESVKCEEFRYEDMGYGQFHIVFFLSFDEAIISEAEVVSLFGLKEKKNYTVLDYESVFNTEFKKPLPAFDSIKSNINIYSSGYQTYYLKTVPFEYTKAVSYRNFIYVESYDQYPKWETTVLDPDTPTIVDVEAWLNEKREKREVQ